MAIFQKTERREDTVPKRNLTKDDISFLDGLQRELNEQSTMGNRDPRFWVIRQPVERITDEDHGSAQVHIAGSDWSYSEDEIPKFLEELQEKFEDEGIEGIADFSWIQNAEGLYSIQLQTCRGLKRRILEKLHEITEFICENIEDPDLIEIKHIETEYEPVPNTLFLTHKACEEHLKAYSYNYKPTAQGYAMTAQRSPEMEKLIEILQQIDWKSIGTK